jgi:hypothetical protein
MQALTKFLPSPLSNNGTETPVPIIAVTFAFKTADLPFDTSAPTTGRLPETKSKLTGLIHESTRTTSGPVGSEVTMCSKVDSASIVALYRPGCKAFHSNESNHMLK